MKKLLNWTTFLIAYDNSTGWKLDQDGKIEMKDGNPVFINASGQEMTVAQDTITKLNGEAKAHREAKEQAEKKLKVFEGLDPVKAKEALDTVSKLDQKKLIDAGQVDEVKNQITTQFQEQLSAKEKELEEKNSRINSMMINDVFKGSDFARNNINVPYDMFEATFKSNFKVEDDKVVAYGKDGNRLHSKTKVGEYADAEEALQMLVDMHPQKEQILKADVGAGSGSGGGGSNRPGGSVIKRADFDKLHDTKKAEISAKVRSGEMQLLD